MRVRPRDLADRMSDLRQPQIFRLPIDAARLKARESSINFRKPDIWRWSKTGGSFPTVRSNSRCDICRLRTEQVGSRGTVVDRNEKAARLRRPFRLALRRIDQRHILKLLDWELFYVGRGVELLQRGHSSGSGGKRGRTFGTRRFGSRRTLWFCRRRD